MLLIGKFAFLLTLMPSVESYDGIDLDRIRGYLGANSSPCKDALAALDVVLKTKPQARIFRNGNRLRYDETELNLIRSQRLILMKHIHSPRLSREALMAHWRLKILEARTHRTTEESIRTDNYIKDGNALRIHATEWVNAVIEKERRTTEAVLHALEIQSQLEPDGVINPTFSFHHASHEDQMWVWRFDNQRDQTGSYFREDARRLLKPVATSIRDLAPDTVAIGANLRDEVLNWFDSRNLIGQLADEMKLRDFSLDYRQRFVELLKKLGIDKHPFGKRAIERNPDMVQFMEGKVFDERMIIDTQKMLKAILAKDIEEAERLLAIGEIDLAKRNSEPDYFDLEPVVMIAIRELISEALSSPEAFAFVPRKTQRDGSLIVAFDGIQIQIYRAPSGAIHKVTLNFWSGQELSYLFKRKRDPIEFQPPDPGSSSAATSRESDYRAKPTSEPKAQAPLVRLDLSDLELPDAVNAEFERLNEKNPGHHEFLELAAKLVAGYPEFFESRGMTWFFNRVSKRMYLDGRTNKDIALQELETDIQKYQDNREEFDRNIADVSERSRLDEANSLMAFVREGSSSLDRLKAETKYSFQFPRTPKPLSIKFSPEVTDFLKDPSNHGIQYLRAIQRGPVGKRSVSGVVKLYGDIKRDYDLDFEIRVIRKGAHLRPVVRVLSDGTWYVLKVVEELPQ